MAQHSEETFSARDGLQLYGQSWHPEGAPHGVVLIVHGFGEHSGRYLHVAARLADAGFVVYAYDQRGHGRSEGDRAYVTTFRDYLMRLRIDTAARRLRRDNQSILDIACSVGFNDPSQFARLFRRHMGVTPRAYRTTASPAPIWTESTMD